jgi:CheY-like chemotaxis protein
MDPKKILLIDDDPNITKLLKAKLEARGDIVTETTNEPGKSVELAKAFQPNLIVCDIDMPEWGSEVAQKLADEPLTSKIPLVFLSSMVTTKDMSKPSGGRRLISKKIPLPDIIWEILAELK